MTCEPATQLDVRDFGVLFRAPMVRALRAGAKTMTRRAVTPNNSVIDGHPMTMAARKFWGDLDFDDVLVDPGPSPMGNPGPYMKVACPRQESRHRIYPRWQVGDRLWCKETWCPLDQDGRAVPPGFDLERGRGLTVAYRADRDDLAGEWRPSLLMPRWASRTLLEVTANRPERLNQIPWFDIRAEGVRCPEHDFESGFCVSECPDLRAAFRALWESINGRESYGPQWVWATTFRRLEPA